MINQKVKKIIEENPVALATITKDNKPNVIAVAYIKVVSDTELVITNNFMKTTVEDISNNPNVCLAVWDKDWNGYKIIGSAKYHETGEWLDFVKNLPENKGLPAKGAILVKVENVLELH